VGNVATQIEAPPEAPGRSFVPRDGKPAEVGSSISRSEDRLLTPFSLQEKQEKWVGDQVYYKTSDGLILLDVVAAELLLDRSENKKKWWLKLKKPNASGDELYEGGARFAQRSVRTAKKGPNHGR